MITIVLQVLIPIVKYFIEKKAAKRLSDKEFVDFILAHQKRRSKAGQSSVDFEKALKEAENEMKESNDKDK